MQRAVDFAIQLSDLGLLGDRDHVLEQDLERHAVSATLMGDKVSGVLFVPCFPSL